MLINFISSSIRNFINPTDEEKIGSYLTKPLKDYSPKYQELPVELIQSTLSQLQLKYSINPCTFYNKLPPSEKLKINVPETKEVYVRPILPRGVREKPIHGVKFKVKIKNKNLSNQNKRKLLLEKRKLEKAIIKSDVFKNWKTGRIKEEYELLIAAVHNHTTLTDCEELVCPITLSYPTVPVRAPDNQVYDKEAIEEHLAIKFYQLDQARRNQISQSDIEKLKGTISPVRGQPFTKDDLVYDCKFAKRVIKQIRKDIINQQLESTAAINDLF